MKGSKKFMKAPFPAIGGKGAIVGMVADRFGHLDNLVEPFAFSAAFTLKNPNGPVKRETLNDLNCYVANFWRAVKMAPDQVADHLDWPVNEVDLQARHTWLVDTPASREFRHQITSDPEYFDPKFAGWWAWGACLWIGSGWCEERGVNWKQRPKVGLKGVHGRPQLGDARSRGRGVHANDSANTCAERKVWIYEWIATLSDRLRNVRVCCGDWKRVCGSKTVTTRLGLTGVFLDPPYRLKVDGKKSRAVVYATDKGADLDKLHQDVKSYCLARGDEAQMRIAVCGLAGEGFEELEAKGWEVVAWTSSGYGNTASGRKNAARERVWFSPHCMKPEEDRQPLFKGIPDA